MHRLGIARRRADATSRAACRPRACGKRTSSAANRTSRASLGSSCDAIGYELRDAARNACSGTVADRAACRRRRCTRLCPSLRPRSFFRQHRPQPSQSDSHSARCQLARAFALPERLQCVTRSEFDLRDYCTLLAMRAKPKIAVLDFAALGPKRRLTGVRDAAADELDDVLAACGSLEVVRDEHERRARGLVQVEQQVEDLRARSCCRGCPSARRRTAATGRLRTRARSRRAASRRPITASDSGAAAARGRRRRALGARAPARSASR